MRRFTVYCALGVAAGLCLGFFAAACFRVPFRITTFLGGCFGLLVASYLAREVQKTEQAEHPFATEAQIASLSCLLEIDMQSWFIPDKFRASILRKFRQILGGTNVDTEL